MDTAYCRLNRLYVLGLDALSAQIEEPFGLQENDLPLDSIVRLIERESLSSLGQPLPPIIEAQTTIYFNKKRDSLFFINKMSIYGCTIILTADSLL